jgi:hypothetical protein
MFQLPVCNFLYVKELMESVEISGVNSTILRSYNTELVTKLINLVSAACQVRVRVIYYFDMSVFVGPVSARIRTFFGIKLKNKEMK